MSLARILFFAVFCGVTFACNAFCQSTLSKELASSEYIHKMDRLMNESRFVEAIKVGDRALKAHPKNMAVKADLALACLYAGELRRAQLLAEQVEKSDIKNHEAHWVLTNVYSINGRTADSASQFELSTKYRSKRPCKPCQKKSNDLLNSFKSLQQAR